jgi:hypothetical protein
MELKCIVYLITASIDIFEQKENLTNGQKSYVEKGFSYTKFGIPESNKCAFINHRRSQLAPLPLHSNQIRDVKYIDTKP